VRVTAAVCLQVTESAYQLLEAERVTLFLLDITSRVRVCTLSPRVVWCRLMLRR
jgi:hypothetical protein